MFYIIMYLFRFSAIYLAGATCYFAVFEGAPFWENIASLGLAAFMWLLAMGLNILQGKPPYPRLLNTPLKRIIAGAIVFFMGFSLGMN